MIMHISVVVLTLTPALVKVDAPSVFRKLKPTLGQVAVQGWKVGKGLRMWSLLMMWRGKPTSSLL